MPEVHLPHLDDEAEADEAADQKDASSAPPASAASITHRGAHGRSLIRIALEVVLIGMGVFLGLAGEQWRENAEHRELANGSLRRFRAEVRANRESVARVKDYHVEVRKQLIGYLEVDPQKRRRAEVHLEGVQPAVFERAAWDLALATQSLAYIDPDLVFALSRIYTEQERYSGLTMGMTQAMYIQNPRVNVDPFFAALAVYYDDLVIIEPALLKSYDDLLPRLERAIGESER